MLKFEDECVLEWFLKTCKIAWEKGRVPDDCMKAIIAPLYTGKGQNGCTRNKGELVSQVLQKSVC